jgi:alcohol dehydrogenase
VQAALAAGAGPVLAIDSVEDRLEVARQFGAVPVHLTEDDPRQRAKELMGGRGFDVTVDAVGHPDALDLAIRLARKAGTVVAIGVYAERAPVHMGLVWIKGLTLRAGPANVIGHVDRVLGMLQTGALDPTPLVTTHMALDDAPEAYARYDRREALKIVLTP